MGMIQNKNNWGAMCIHSQPDAVTIEGGGFMPAYLCRHPKGRKPVNCELLCSLTIIESPTGGPHRCRSMKTYEGPEAMRPDEL